MNDTETAIHALSIDDEEPNLLIVEAMGEEVGLKVHSFNNPIKALESMKSHEYDLVFVDYLMPEMDGISVISNIRKNLPDVPIIMITSVKDHSLMVNALESGATEFLTKPLNMPEFKARISNLVELRQAHLLIRDRAKLLAEEVRKATQDIIDREHETIEVLARAADYKDQETGEHIARVAYYTKIIATSMEQSEEFIDLIFKASPLHDIGKIATPDAILAKPDKLTENEIIIMKTHPQMGHDLLINTQSPYLRAGAVISLRHHEKWDGSGYPDGLNGEKIPLIARITTISDVFDALISERPYKDAWSFDDAVQYIQEESGRLFDPEIASHFMKNIDKIHDIYNTLQDE